MRSAIAVLAVTTMAMSLPTAAFKAEVKVRKGSPTLLLDDRPTVPLVFYAEPNLAPGSHYPSQARMANEQGITLVSFSLPVPWPRPGEAESYDLVDQAFRNVLSLQPNAKVLIRTGAQAPVWWLDAHPEEETRYSDWTPGKQEPLRHASVASRRWREDYVPHLRAFIEYCEQHWGDHILGYHVCGLNTGEWFYERSWEPVYSGFEEPMRAGFAQYALARYGGVEKTREVWNMPALAPDTIRVPSVEERDRTSLGLFRSPRTDAFVADFLAYQQEAVVEALETFAATIKETTKRQKLVAFFYGYYFELNGLPKGPCASGHMALSRLLRCKDVDILCAPISYLARARGGFSGFMPPVDSVRAAGKLWINEDDTRTWLSATSDPAFTAIKGTKNVIETQWEHRRSFGHLAPRRMGTWYMDLIGDGWLNDAGIWQGVGQLKNEYEQLLARKASFQPEFAVVVDDRAAPYVACTNAMAGPLCSTFRDQWYRVGTNVSIELLSDVIDGRVRLPKASLFIGCFRLSNKERARLVSLLNGKAAFFTYGSGYLSEHDADTANIAALTGMAIKEDAGGGPSGMTFTNDGPLVDGVQNATCGSDELRLTPRWSISNQSELTPLARFTDGTTAAAARHTAHGLRVYLGTTGCPSRLLWNLLKEADVHLYAASGNIVVADEQFLSLTSGSDGIQALRLPSTTKRLIRLDTGEHIPVLDGEAGQSMISGETRHYLIER